MKKYILPITLLVLFLMPTALASGDIKINDFSANVTNGTVPLHTYFTGNVTGNITNWHWKFTNTGTNVTTYSNANITVVHTFGKPGSYNITLTVWGSNGNDTLTKPSYIIVNNSTNSTN